MSGLPQLPAGFQLEQSGGMPPLPPGFQIEPPKALSMGDRALDVAKSFGVGVAEESIGVAGLPRDASSLMNKGMAYLEGKLGRDPEAIRKSNEASAAAPSIMPGSQSIQKSVEGVTGDFYKPQTTLGEYAKTAGSFALLAALGPGGLARRAATNILAPTVGSEVAGSLTKGTEYEPYARAAGALVGGVGASKIASGMDARSAARAAAGATPSIGELKDAARAQYKHPEVSAVEINPQAGVSLRDAIKADLQGQGFRSANQGPVFSTIEELANPVGKTLKIADVDSTRKALSKLATERDAVGAMTPTATAATKAMDHINDFLPNLKQADLLAGNATKANAILNDARGNWGAAKRAETVATKVGNAELMAASTYGGGNINNATRQQLRPLLMNNAAKTAGYSDDATAALNNVVKGSILGNATRAIGKLAPTGPVGVGLHIGAGFGSGGASLAALPLTYGAKKLGESMTRNAVGRLDTALRADSPLAKLNNQQTIAALQQSDSPMAAALLRAIIAAQVEQPKSHAPATRSR